MAPAQSLNPGEALPPVVQGSTEKAPELLASKRPEPLDPSPFSQTSPPSSPNGWPQERSPAGHPNSASPRGPVPSTLPGLRHAPWQGPRAAPDSPDGSPLTPVPTQMPWLVASPEPPQNSPTPAFPLAASYDANGPTQPPLPEKRHGPGSGQQPSPPARSTNHVTFAPPLPDVTQPPGMRVQRDQNLTSQRGAMGSWGLNSVPASPRAPFTREPKQRQVCPGHIQVLVQATPFS